MASTNFKKIDKVSFNNYIVGQRSTIKQGINHVINKLTREADRFRRKKTANDQQKEKNARRADRYIEELKYIKSLHPDDVTKFAVLCKKSYKEVGSDPNSKIEERALTMLSEHKQIQHTIKKFREEYPNWSAEVPDIIKILGVNYRKKRLKTLAAKGKLDPVMEKERKLFLIMHEAAGLDVDPKMLQSNKSIISLNKKKRVKTKDSKNGKHDKVIFGNEEESDFEMDSHESLKSNKLVENSDTAYESEDGEDAATDSEGDAEEAATDSEGDAEEGRESEDGVCDANNSANGSDEENSETDNADCDATDAEENSESEVSTCVATNSVNDVAEENSDSDNADYDATDAEENNESEDGVFDATSSVKGVALENIDSDNADCDATDSEDNDAEEKTEIDSADCEATDSEKDEGDVTDSEDEGDVTDSEDEGDVTDSDENRKSENANCGFEATVKRRDNEKKRKVLKQNITERKKGKENVSVIVEKDTKYCEANCENDVKSQTKLNILSQQSHINKKLTNYKKVSNNLKLKLLQSLESKVGENMHNPRPNSYPNKKKSLEAIDSIFSSFGKSNIQIKKKGNSIGKKPIKSLIKGTCKVKQIDLENETDLLKEPTNSMSRNYDNSIASDEEDNSTLLDKKKSSFFLGYHGNDVDCHDEDPDFDDDETEGGNSRKRKMNKNRSSFFRTSLQNEKGAPNNDNSSRNQKQYNDGLNRFERRRQKFGQLEHPRKKSMFNNNQDSSVDDGISEAPFYKRSKNEFSNRNNDQKYKGAFGNRGGAKRNYNDKKRTSYVQNSGSNTIPLGNRQTLSENKAPTESLLHPSWAAKKKEAQLSSALNAFEGKRVTFDD